MLLGENTALVPVGSPVTLSVMVEYVSWPEAPMMLILSDPEEPMAAMRVVDCAEMVKSPTPNWTVTLCENEPLVAVTVTV